MRLRSLRTFLAVALGSLVGVGAAAIVSNEFGVARTAEVPDLLWPDPPALPDFTLTDHRGAAFEPDRLVGRWTFLFFGYTRCPDVCPATLSMLATVSETLDSARTPRGTVQFVFVTVDPARDTLDHLGEYVTAFDPRFVGVTGAAREIARFTRKLGIHVEPEAKDGAGDHLVSHTSAVLLIDPRVRLVKIHQAPHDPAAMAENFHRIRRFLGG